MSIVLVGSTSGSITLQEPAVAGTTTIDLPATSGTALVAPTALTVPNTTGTVMVSGNMPAFSAYRTGANQSISNNTRTVVQYNAEYFDTNSNYDTSTYRFTPTVAGYYQVNFVVGCNGTSVSYCESSILKNGSVFKFYGLINATIGSGAYLTGSDVIYMNGTTDYLQVAGYITAVSGTAFSSDSGWSACLLRTA